MRIKKRAGWITLAVLLVGAVASSLALAASRDAHKRSHAERAHAAQTSGASVSSDESAAFGALRRSRATSDPIPTEVSAPLAGAQQRLGLDFDQSRLLTTAGSMSVWLVPGAGHLCLVERDSQLGTGSLSCGAASSAETVGIFGTVPGGMFGLLPDGSSAVTVTRADGTSRSVAPSDNGVVAAESQSVSKLSYTGPDGASHAIPLPQSAPAPPNPCPAGAGWCQ
jgi:hypothetical protein